MKIIISAPTEILRIKVDRFVNGHKVQSVEYVSNKVAIITYS